MSILFACVAESPLVGVATSEDGGWSLALIETTYDQGTAAIVVGATAMEAPSATGLTLYLRPDMPDMTHTRDVVHFEEGEPGAYNAAMLFDMSGLWTLTGYVGDSERTESVTFVVEVLS